MQRRRLALICFVFILYLMPVFGSAQEGTVPQLINYQGKLTAEGQSLPTGDYTLSFSIYDKPVGAPCSLTREPDCARRVWGPQVFDGESGRGHGAQVPVVRGFFNVILGPYDTDGNPIADAFVAPNRFVEVTVAGDEPILPRQQVYSVPFALASLNGLPIGGITMFSGNPDDLPDNWKVCNGQRVNDSASPFNGRSLPDLRGLFVRGADSNNVVGRRDGSDNYADRHSHRFGYTALTEVELSSYDYYDKVVTDIDFFGVARMEVRSSNKGVLAINSDSGESHTHRIRNEGTTSQYRRGFDNRPRHINLHYIIRIK